MFPKPVERGLRANIFDPNLPPIAEGEVAVWNANGQLVRSRQSQNGFVINPSDGDGLIDVVNGSLRVLTDGSYTQRALGQAQIIGGNSVRLGTNENFFGYSVELGTDVFLVRNAEDEIAFRVEQFFGQLAIGFFQSATPQRTVTAAQQAAINATPSGVILDALIAYGFIRVV